MRSTAVLQPQPSETFYASISLSWDRNLLDEVLFELGEHLLSVGACDAAVVVAVLLRDDHEARAHVWNKASKMKNEATIVQQTYCYIF